MDFLNANNSEINFNDPKTWLLVLVLVWTMIWKMLALWNASKADKKAWFVVLLIINTFGILEIIYLFMVAKKSTKEVFGFFERKGK